MYYRKTDDFDSFRCLAGACPLSCCAAWQIVIDENSLARYRTFPGEMGRALHEGIDWEEECYRQGADRRCSMLLDDGLCRLQKQCGEAALCRTCTLYPRHCEEYDGVREWTLSLSCPEAARMLLTRTEPMRWVESEDDTPEPDPDDEFDDMFYDRILCVRERFMALLQDRQVPVTERMGRMLALAAALQERLDDGDIFGLDDVLDGEEPSARDAVTGSAQAFPKLRELETLYPDWSAMLEKTAAAVVDDAFLTRQRELLEQYAVPCEQMLVYFTDVYLCGAVYDDELCARAALAAYSVCWIGMIADANGLPLQEAAQRYAREVQHSDINPDELIEYLADGR